MLSTWSLISCLLTIASGRSERTSVSAAAALFAALELDVNAGGHPRDGTLASGVFAHRHRAGAGPSARALPHQHRPDFTLLLSGIQLPVTAWTAPHVRSRPHT